MNQKPTTFELAQLAAQAAPPNARPKDAVRRALELWQEAEVGIAECENRAEYLRGLFQSVDGKNIPIFTDPPKDWLARLKCYPGEDRDVDRALWNKTFPAELVEKRLFKDKTLTKTHRHKFLLGLARACIRFDMEGPPIAYRGRPKYLGDGGLIPEAEGFPIHPQNLVIAEKNRHAGGKRLIPEAEVNFVRQVEALLAKPSLDAHLVRWAVEVRQRQVAEAKKRVISPSLRRKRDGYDRHQRIQARRTFSE